MNDAVVHERLQGVVDTIDQWAKLWDRWTAEPGYDDPRLESEVRLAGDEVRKRVRLARDVVTAMGEKDLALMVVEHGQSYVHPYTQARKAIVEAIAIVAQREELASIVGPVGPRLSASELHPTIWGSAAALWDDGYHPQAVQTAAQALEGLLQAKAGSRVSGENLGKLFTTNDPTQGSPRLRLRGIDANTDASTWNSAHEGAASSVRAAFMAVRNLVSHPGWPPPTAAEALEMLAVLSYVAHLVDRSDVAKAPATV